MALHEEIYCNEAVTECAVYLWNPILYPAFGRKKYFSQLLSFNEGKMSTVNQEISSKAKIVSVLGEIYIDFTAFLSEDLSYFNFKSGL